MEHCRLLERYHLLELKCCLRCLCRIWLKQVTLKRLLTSYKATRHHFSEDGKFQSHLFSLYLDKENNQCIREKNRSTEYSKGNKTIPEKVATTRTEDGHK